MMDKVEPQFDIPNWEGQLVKCGKWIAELAHNEIYSEGLVFVRYTDDAPAFWGQDKPFPELYNATTLIDKMSKIMVDGLECSQPCKCRCQLVYVASLNEGDFENVQAKKPLSLGLHFWLLPRYQHDEGFLKRINEDGSDNDGFALITEWRKQFLLRNKTGQSKHFPKPRTVDFGEWAQYAARMRIRLREAACKLGLPGL